LRHEWNLVRLETGVSRSPEEATMMSPKDLFDLFMQPCEWTKTIDGWRRAPMNGITVDIVDCGNGFYQTIVDRDGVSRVFRHDFPHKPCDSPEKAREYAWTLACPLLETPPDRERKASVSMTL
jgi:hypothetical protein